MRSPIAATALLASITATACTREMPPAAAPAREVPRVEEAPATPPPPGMARIVLDADGERAHVDEVTGEVLSRGAQLTRRLCSTMPCVVDLPNGDHELIFTSDVAYAAANGRSERVNVRVAGAPKVVRHAIGHTEQPWEGSVGGFLAGIGVTSAIFCWIPFLVGAASTNQGTKDSWNSAGVVMAAGGGIAVLVGAILMIAAPAEHTPGSTTEWVLPSPERREQPVVPQSTALFRF